MEHTNYFFSKYFTSTSIWNGFIRFKVLKQLGRKTKIEFSLRVNERAYRCGNASLSVGKLSKIMFESQSTTQVSVACDTEDLHDRRRSFKRVIQIAQIYCRAYRAQHAKLADNGEAFYASSRSDQDNKGQAFTTHPERTDHVYHKPQKQTLLRLQIHGLFEDYCRGRHEWATKRFENKVAWILKTMFVHNVMHTNTIRQNVGCTMEVKQKSFLDSKN